MIWTLKKISENDKSIVIGYSYGNNHSCDGIIVYDKLTHENTLKKLSYIEGKSEHFAHFVGEKAFQFIHGLLRQNKLTERPYIVVTG